MKKNELIRCIGFVIATAVIFQLLSNVITYYPSLLKTRIQGFYAEPKNSLDVVYIGSSSVHPYFSPALAYAYEGFTSYDFSTDAQPITLIKYLMKEALSQQTPNVLVVDIRLFAWTSEEYQQREINFRNVNDTTAMRPSFNRLNMVRELAPQENRMYYYLPLLNYHYRWQDGLTETDWDYILPQEDLLKGCLIEKSIVPFEKPVLGDIQEPINPYAKTVLDDLLQYCDTLKQQVLFVASPSIIDIGEPSIGEYTKVTVYRQQNWVNNYIRTYGYPVIDGNQLYDTLEVDFSKDFYNAGHMNIYGMQKWTTYLAGHLKDTYSLPDHRNDKSYAKRWDKAVQETVERLKPELNIDISNPPIQ